MNMCLGLLCISVAVLLCHTHDTGLAAAAAHNNRKRATTTENDILRGMASQAVNAAEANKKALDDYKQSSESTMSKMERELASLKYGVAFTVYMSSSLKQGGILPFRGVLLNHGNHFDVSTYKFSCPVDGIYVFIYNLYSGTLSKDLDTYSGGKLMVDGVRYSTAKSWAETSQSVGLHETGSAVATCHAGKKVWIEMYHNSDVQIYGSSDKDTTFSGFLLYRL